MLNFLKQSRYLVLIIKDYEVKLMLWENDQLAHLAHFADFKDNQEHFDELLDDYAKYPLIILTDFIEESFRNETVVHVAATDRKALLDRKLNYSFRNTQYRIARITGREPEGRRDDMVLLSALTKSELINPWVAVILSKNIAIQCVTSVAYLLEICVAIQGESSTEHLMVVNLEGDTRLRQTYLKNGRVMFSRLATINAEGVVAVGESIRQESLQIRKYLERIRLLPFESPLRVQVYSNVEPQDLEQGLKSSDYNFYQTFNVKREALEYQFDLKDEEPSSILVFLAQALSKKRVENAYGSFEMRRYFYLGNIAKSLVACSLALVAITLALKMPSALDTWDRWQQEQQVLAQTQPLLSEYDRLTQRFPETPIPSKEIALVVETYERIDSQTHLPVDAMGIISQALTLSPDLQITGMNWVMAEGEASTEVDQYGRLVSFIGGDGDPFIQAILDGRSILKVEINGIAYSPNSYRAAQDQVQVFADALGSFPGVSVTPLQMPTDVRTDIEVNTTVDDAELRAPFILELRMESAG